MPAVLSSNGLLGSARGNINDGYFLCLSGLVLHYLYDQLFSFVTLTQKSMLQVTCLSMVKLCNKCKKSQQRCVMGRLHFMVAIGMLATLIYYVMIAWAIAGRNKENKEYETRNREKEERTR